VTSEGVVSEVLRPYLEASARLHHGRLCPRQVLGVRMGLWAGELLELGVPREDKRLVALVETDGCFADGVAVATGCWLGRRTLRLIPYGKVAATFADTQTGGAVRLAPSHVARTRALAYAPGAADHWHAQRHGYQVMPSGELLVARKVEVSDLPRPLAHGEDERAICAACQEEVGDGKAVVRDGRTLCWACGEGAYYQLHAGPE
jgi:formylmethanofuran dehydrogenase subunit E